MSNWRERKSRRLAQRILDKLAFHLHHRLESLRKVEAREAARQALDGVRFMGNGVRVNGAIHLSGADCCSVGNNVHIGSNAYFRAEGGLVIGDHTHISRNVTIYTINYEYEGVALPYDHRQRYRSVTIGRNVWIGMNVNIVPGTRIGDGAIVGMGATVSGVVPAGAIVGAPCAQIIKHRDSAHYERLVAARQYGGANGRLLSAEDVAAFKIRTDDANPFFVVSTGRSGSMTIARTLSQHPEVVCSHEPRIQLIRLSTQWAEGSVEQERLRAELDALYANTVSPAPVCGESDQNLTLLLDYLLERYPKAPIVWLIRDGRDVVASGNARGWYHPGVSDNVRRAAWDAYRLQGDRVGDVLSTQWEVMTPFEKNCWYWAYMNRTIRERCSKLPESQWLQVRLEFLAERIDALFRHIGVEPVPVEVERHNESKQRVRSSDAWTAEERSAFDKICGAEMDLAYPGWR